MDTAPGKVLDSMFVDSDTSVFLELTVSVVLESLTETYSELFLAPLQVRQQVNLDLLA